MRKAFRPEIRNSSLGESLSHPPNAVSLDEQRQSMVLELYCRKAGRKREGRRERERDREKGLERKRVRGREKRRGERRRQREGRGAESEG